MKIATIFCLFVCFTVRSAAVLKPGGPGVSIKQLGESRMNGIEETGADLLMSLKLLSNFKGVPGMSNQP